MSAKTKKIRILHVFGRMDRGGAETWIMHAMRNVDRERYLFDFLVLSPEHGAFDEEIRELGGRVIHIGTPRNLPFFIVKLYRYLAFQSRYDVIHSHVHHFSGLVLTVAKLAGVSTRIAHSHNDLANSAMSLSLFRRCYLAAMKYAIDKTATVGIGVSTKAAESLFGTNYKEKPGRYISYCGIDLDQFGDTANSTNIRRELGIEADTFVVGHVGSFTRQKNHDFIIEIAEATREVDPNVVFLLVGDGALKPLIMQRIHQYGLDETVLLAGTRTDVPQLMTDVMDVFILPSLFEGLPVVLMEAQAAGLQSLVAETVTKEAEVASGCIDFLPITDPLVWRDRILNISKSNTASRKCTDRWRLAGTRFDISESVMNLQRVYDGKA